MAQRKRTRSAGGQKAKKTTAKTTKRATTKKKRDPRLPAPGTVLTREYKGKTIRVTVKEDGFRSGGKDYRSLSGIARELTGTKSERRVAAAQSRSATDGAC